jgi:hypothetical protein
MELRRFSIHLKKLIWIGILLMISSGVWVQEVSKVFVTKMGAKYHKSSCRYAQMGWASSLSDAKDRGLTACLVCKPGGRSATTSTKTSFSATNSLTTTPSTGKPASSTSSSQCRATTKAGSRCSRKASSGSGNCMQHAG